MSKYDYEIGLSLNTSTGLILSKLKPCSVILEFGCATGRMTRYMKETLNCQVYIVEYEEHAFQKAMEFAQDGICDDIQNYEWLEYFGEVAFDAIIFADVLEHLQDPEEVLKKAADLLKDDGSIYISVPNVTHNDIVLKTIGEHFDYTETGLLDNTHIHFWGLENIKVLGRDAGLTVRKLEGTCCTMGNTEQNVQLGKNLLLENILRERAAGEIYQFVLTLDKNESNETTCAIDAPGIYSHVYLDTGYDFNAQERIAVNAVYSENGNYIVHYELTEVGSVARVRLDPIEGQGVVLRHISVCQNGEERKLLIPNAIHINGGIYLHGDDPMVIAQLQPGKGHVTIDAEFVLPGVQYLDMLENALRAEHMTVEEKQQQICSLQRSMNLLKKNMEERDRQLLQIEQRNDQLQSDVNGYIMLINQKEKLTLHMEQKVAELEVTVEYYQNLKVVKILAWTGRVLRKIKRGIKKLLKRG